MNTFIKSLPPELRNDFSNLCRKGTPESILEMYRFLRRIGERREIVSKAGVVVRRVSVVDGFISHYRDVVAGNGSNHRNSNRVIARFVIERTAYDPNNNYTPIIPGSSVKGAMRTAVLNVRKKGARLQKYYGYKESNQLEKDILEGNFSSDPFSLVKVSDFVPVRNVRTAVVYGINRKKTGGKGRGPHQIFEVVIEGEFEGTVTVMKPPTRERKIKKPLSINEILQVCWQFYTGELRREAGELENMKEKVSFSWRPKFNLKTEVPLRIGRHSGAECVTIEGFRKIRVRTQDSYKILDHATTLWLASSDRKPRGCKPFGWCVLV